MLAQTSAIDSHGLLLTSSPHAPSTHVQEEDMLTQTFGLALDKSPQEQAATIALLEQAERHLVQCRDLSPPPPATTTAAASSEGAFRAVVLA